MDLNFNASASNQDSSINCFSIPDLDYDSDSDTDDDNYNDAFDSDLDYDDAEFEKRRDFIADVITYFVFDKYLSTYKKDLSLKDALNKVFPGTYLEVRETLKGMKERNPVIRKIIDQENLLPNDDLTN